MLFQTPPPLSAQVGLHLFSPLGGRDSRSDTTPAHHWQTSSTQTLLDSPPGRPQGPQLQQSKLTPYLPYQTRAPPPAPIKRWVPPCT